MIRIDGLWKAFGDKEVLRGITLEVEEGTTFVVLGASGSGKTVLLKHVIGLLKPDRGTVHVDGREISTLTGRELNEARRVFGMVFQGAALFDSMTVFDNVAFPVRERERRIPHDELLAQVIESLRVVDLGEDVLDGGRPSSPAACASGSRWRGRWSPTPRSCSTTSPPPASTPSPPTRWTR